MPCHIVGESLADVRVRIQPGWEMDVRKDLILAVEEVVIAAKDRVN
jgi:bisphosphoglycerate-dependent phosphoglycerate mutase